MKSTLLAFIFLSATLYSTAQPPVLYLNFVSHNEPKDSLQQAPQYFQSKNKCIQFANLMLNKGASWNLGTCGFFAEGALNHDNAATNPNDIFETLSGSAYSANVEIDPRTKNQLFHNTADAVYLIDSCGGVASNTLSGFTWYSATPSDIDWMNYDDTLTGNVYGNKWKADLLWGAGSKPAHSNDLEDLGVWKPDTTTNFYGHNPNRSFWYIGNGCSPKLDTLTDEQEIIAQVRGIVDSIQNGLMPASKFYCYTITLGQDEFGPTLFNQVATVCDSVNAWGTSKVIWATINQKFAAFQNWQTSSGLEYSQWLCDGTTGIDEPDGNTFNFRPNPVSDLVTFRFDTPGMHQVEIYSISGELLLNTTLQSEECLNINMLDSGIYLLVVDHQSTARLIRQ